MPIAPALMGSLIREPPDIRLVGELDQSCESIHSILLMTLSPYFEIVLKGEQKTICMWNSDCEVLKIVKEYAYDGKITGLSKDNVLTVKTVADYYNIVGILNECDIFMKNTNIQAR